MKCPRCQAVFHATEEQDSVDLKARRKADAKRQKERYYRSSRENSREVKVATKGSKAPHVRKTNGFRPPDYKEVRAYCEERENQIDPVQFVDFYAAKGWMVGKSKMKDWQAAVRTWEKRE